MKFLITLIPCLALSLISEAQVALPDSLFIVTYTTGPAWDATKKPNEQTHFKEHGMNLSALRKAGTIKFGARYSDKGIIVISASSFKAAKDLIYADQAVTSNLFHADIQKLSPFYEGCIEKPKTGN
jgi:hypothetical protein